MTIPSGDNGFQKQLEVFKEELKRCLKIIHTNSKKLEAFTSVIEKEASSPDLTEPQKRAWSGL